MRLKAETESEVRVKVKMKKETESEGEVLQVKIEIANLVNLPCRCNVDSIDGQSSSLLTLCLDLSYVVCLREMYRGVHHCWR